MTDGPAPNDGDGWLLAPASGDTKKPGNFNRNAAPNSPDIYLYYRTAPKNSGVAPIGHLMAGYSIVEGDEGLGRAIRDFPTDYVVLRQHTNEDTGGDWIFLGYKYA